MTQIVSRDLRDGEETPEYEGTHPPTHGREQLFRVSGFMDSEGVALEFTSYCYFLIIYFSHLQVCFPIFMF